MKQIEQTFPLLVHIPLSLREAMRKIKGGFSCLTNQKMVVLALHEWIRNSAPISNVATEAEILEMIGKPPMKPEKKAWQKQRDAEKGGAL